MRIFPELKRIAYDSVTLGGNDYFRPGFLESEAHKGWLQKYSSRVGALAVRGLPDFMFNLVTRNYRKKGCEVLGLGYHSVVIADGDNYVRKIHHRTLYSGADERQAYIDRLYRKQRLLCDHFPSEMIELQDFVIEEFPLNPSLTCVVSKQKRIFGNGMDYAEIRAHNDIMDLCQHMFDKSEALPDIVGKKNIFQVSWRNLPVIVDTIPVEKSDPSDHEAYRRAQEILWGAPG